MDNDWIPQRRIRYNDVTIGWICATSPELLAARSMLDEEYDLSGQKEGDTNTYIVGRISRHNVVIACLDSSDDPSSATSTAVQLLRSFPNIKCGLMVGIGGGVPHPDHDIRLGDVVVGYPRGISGGIVAFEVGKAVQDTTEYRGHFNSAPDSLRNAANALTSDKGLKRYQGRMTSIMKDASDKLTESAWPPPNPDLDILHCSKATHDADHDAAQCYLYCDPVSKQAKRLARQDRTPKIHCGLIASSHKIIADERQRDRIVDDLQAKFGFKILCFEMEAFSLSNKFPCLIVRGISDYADSTKNDIWQRYASLSAAAYAKELLITLRPTITEREKSLLDQSEALSQDDPEDGLYRRVMSMFLKDEADSREYTMPDDEVPVHSDSEVTPAEQALNETLPPRNATENGESRNKDNAESMAPNVSEIPRAASLPGDGYSDLPDDTERASSWIRDFYNGIHRDIHEEGIGLEDIRKAFGKKDYRDSTLTHAIARTGDTSLMNQIQAGDLEVVDRLERTPMHLAAELGHNDMVAHLHLRGVSLDRRGAHGVLPIHLAAEGGHIATVDYLQLQGKSISPRDSNGWRPIHYAAQAGRQALIAHLVRQGHTVACKGSHGEMPIHLAAQGGHAELIDYFKSLKIALNVRDELGWTPMHYAAKTGQLAVIDHLVSLRQDVKVTSNTGRRPGTTLFHVAAIFGQHDILLKLQELGLDVRALDHQGKTPRALAANARWHYTERVLEMLEQAMNAREFATIGQRLLQKISPR